MVSGEDVFSVDISDVRRLIQGDGVFSIGRVNNQVSLIEPANQTMYATMLALANS